MVALPNEQFLVRLEELFEKCKTTGTVYLTMKRHAYPLIRNARKKDQSVSTTARTALSDASTQYPCILRATGPAGAKISTIADPQTSTEFLEAYVRLHKTHMTALKRKDRKKTKKSISKEGAGSAATLVSN